MECESAPAKIENKVKTSRLICQLISLIKLKKLAKPSIESWKQVNKKVVRCNLFNLRFIRL